MPEYTPWTWSAVYGRHYCYLIADDGVTILDTIWSGPPTAGSAAAGGQVVEPPPQVDTSSSAPQHGEYGSDPLSSLSGDVKASLNNDRRRFIQTGADPGPVERLDPRFRRVAPTSQGQFFSIGRVFKMLWTEPAGIPKGKTRDSTHFSAVWLNETAYSEIRRFVCVRNKGTFSHCIPIHTYKGRGASKPGLVSSDHGVIYTSAEPPNLLQGEVITKYSIRVEPKGSEYLEPQSRVNYGKPYAVEHNVKVMEIGMVVPEHHHMIEGYFEAAMKLTSTS